MVYDEATNSISIGNVDSAFVGDYNITIIVTNENIDTKEYQMVVQVVDPQSTDDT